MFKTPITFSDKIINFEKSSKKSIFVKFLIFCSGILIIPVLILGIVWNRNIQEVSFDQVKELGINNVEAASEQLERKRLSMVDDLMNILNNTGQRVYGTLDKPENIRKLLNDMQIVCRKYSSLESIYLYDIQSNKIYDTTLGAYKWEKFYDTDWYEQIENSNKVNFLESRINLNEEFFNSNKDFSIFKTRDSCQVITFVSPERSDFQVVMNISIEKLGKWIENIFQGEQKRLIIASKEQILYSGERIINEQEEMEILNMLQDSGVQIYQNTDWIHFIAPIHMTDLYYIESWSMEVVENRNMEYAKYIVNVMKIALLMIIGLSVLAGKVLYRPYGELMERIKMIEAGDSSKGNEDKEWAGIRKLVRNLSMDREIQREQQKSEWLKNVTLFRMTLKGVIPVTYFLKEIRGSYIKNISELKTKILLCKLKNPYFQEEQKKDIFKLNEIINLYLAEQGAGIAADIEMDVMVLFLVAPFKEKLQDIEMFTRKMINEITNMKNHYYSSEVFGGGECLIDYYEQCRNTLDEDMFFESLSEESSQEMVNQDWDSVVKNVITYTAPLIRSIAMCDEQEVRAVIQKLEKELRNVRKKSYAQNLCVRIMTEVERELNVSQFVKDDVVRPIYDGGTLTSVLQYMLIVFIKKIELMQSIEVSQEEIYYKGAIKYMQENYAKAINITDVADSIGISYVHLSRIFKIYQKDGLRMTDYLNHIRIRNAAELLENTKDDLNEIAEKVGYNNAQSLTRFFKKYKGVTPGEYRKQMNGIDR